jgi:hypothetical protein
MSEVDFESQVSSGDEVAGGDKLVPVGEAIRYRKRAQSAEQEAAELRQQLKTSRAENESLAGRVDEIKTEQELVSLLTAAGAGDLEAAMLMAKARMAGSDGDVKSVVEKLRQEKDYLFSQQEEVVSASMTSGVRGRGGSGSKVLQRAAQRAAGSGSRVAVQEYMKLRRKFV